MNGMLLRGAGVILFLLARLAAADSAPGVTNATSQPASTPLQAARELAAAGRAAEARETLRAALAATPDDAELLELRGALERRHGDLAAALSTYEHLHRLRPGDTTVRAVLVLLLQAAATTQPPAEALAAMERAFTLSGEDPAIATALCLAAARAAQPAAVLRGYARLGADARDEAAIRRAAADAFLASQRPAEAAPLYEALLAASPADPALGLAYCEALSGIDTNRGAALLAQAAGRFPGNRAVQLSHARESLAAGQPLTALRVYNALSARNPADAATAQARAEALAQMGAFSLARAALTALGPGANSNLAARIDGLARERAREWNAVKTGLGAACAPTGLLVLAYDTIAERDAATALSARAFITQVEYLQAEGYRFISVRDVAAAQRHRTPLPPASALLIVRGAPASFTAVTLPLLEAYALPAIVAIPTAEIEPGPAAATAVPRLTWTQIAALARHPQLTIASQSHALNQPIACNPQGRLAPAAITCAYLSDAGRYETVDEYTLRIRTDLQTSQYRLREALGSPVDVLVWPEGGCNALTLAAATSLDFATGFVAADRGAGIPDVHAFLAVNPALTFAHWAEAVRTFGCPPVPAARSFGMTVSLDAIVGAASADTQRNLEALLVRVRETEVDRVYLEAWSDADQDGAAEALYFPNRVLPVRADLLNHALGRLRSAGVAVHVVMPTLGLRPPGTEPDPRLFIQEYRWGRIQPTPPPRRRLSPFHPQARQWVALLFEDLAAYVDGDAILLRDDAYLSDCEDFGPPASKFWLTRIRLQERNPEKFTEAERAAWTDLRVATVEQLVTELESTVRRLRPGIRFGRMLAGPDPLTPAARSAVAQDYAAILAAGDYAWLSLDPADPQAGDRLNLRLPAIRASPGGPAGTVIGMRLFAPNHGEWCAPAAWRRLVDASARAGLLHTAYTPERSVPAGQPALRAVQAARKAVEPATAARAPSPSRE